MTGPESATDGTGSIRGAGGEPGAASGDPADPAAANGHRGPHLLSTILHWLTVGYPDGVPPQDRFPLLALMGSVLTHDQIHEVAHTILTESGDLSRSDVEKLISQVTHEKPAAADVDRVRRHLESHGIVLDWPDEKDWPDGKGQTGKRAGT